MELSKDKCQMSTQVSTSSTRLSVENRARLGRLEDTLDFSERHSFWISYRMGYPP